MRASILIALLSVPAFADESWSQVDTARSQAPGFCWRARPLPRCTMFPITEVAYLTALTTTRSDRDPTYGYGGYRDVGSRLAWTVGVMRNTSPSRAHGIVVSGIIGYFDDDVRSVEWRSRQWFGATRSALDVGLGYTQGGVFVRDAPAHGTPSHGATVTAHGVTTSVMLLPIDLVGLTARGDLMFTPGRTHHGISVGAQTGSYGAAIATTALAAFLAILFSGGDF